MQAYLFAYGTLRRDYHLAWKKKIERDLEYIGRGKITATLYDLGSYPGAVKKRAGTGGRGGEEVIGDVFRLHDPEKILRILDKYEGIPAPGSKEAEFVREKSRVSLRSGKKVTAWVYWYNREPGDQPRIRYKDYLNYLKNKSII